MTITSTSKEPPSDTEFGKPWTLEDTFTHTDFRLLYVPPRDEHGKMMIITPSKHEPSYVPDRKFYALSHLWGTDPKDNLWEVSDFISDEDGTTVDPIPMRQEKRETFLNLLQENPGYWWIDVLCCRTDTPPVIMRGVYGCCHTCFAMIDCPPKAIEFFSVYPTTSVLLIDEDENMSTKLKDEDEKGSIQRKEWRHAGDIWKCRWFSRVWTMQELALPSKVMLLSETCDMPCYVSVDLLCDWRIDWLLFMGDEAIAAYELYSHLAKLRVDTVRHLHHGFKNKSKFVQLRTFNWIFSEFAKSRRSCYFVEDYVYGTLGILGWDIPRLNDIEHIWDRFCFSFRRLMEKVLWESFEELGYMTRSDSFLKTLYEGSPERMVKHFEETIHINVWEGERFNLRAGTYSCALSGARNMAEVYHRLLVITVDCSCIHCKKFTQILWRLESFITLKIKN